MSGFLTELHVAGYACLKSIKCTLTPLHAFIGPNDSGKSTVLRAIASLPGAKFGPSMRIFARFGDGSDLRVNHGAPGVHVSGAGGQIVPIAQASTLAHLTTSIAVRVGSGAARIQLVRLNADELRGASNLIPHGQQLVLENRGSNIAGLYDALRDRSVERFTAISKQLTTLFPTVSTLGLRALNQSAKVLMVTLVDGTEVLSDAMSEGLLYYLAFAILAELKRPDMYLIEEPENGLHPSRIADIIRVLRAIAEAPSDPVQVIMATHSPLVVNELRPEEVTVVTRDPTTGSKLTPIKDTPHFVERSKVYALGELWLSYADGKVEAPLFDMEGR